MTKRTMIKRYKYNYCKHLALNYGVLELKFLELSNIQERHDTRNKSVFLKNNLVWHCVSSMGGIGLVPGCDAGTPVPHFHPLWFTMSVRQVHRREI